MSLRLHLDRINLELFKASMWRDEDQFRNDFLQMDFVKAHLNDTHLTGCEREVIRRVSNTSFVDA